MPMHIRNVKHILGPYDLLFSGCRGSFPGVKQPELELNTDLHLASRLRMSRAIILLPLYALKAWAGSAKLFFPFLLSPTDKSKHPSPPFALRSYRLLWTLIFSVQQFGPFAVVFLLVVSSGWRLLLVRFSHFIPHFAKNPRSRLWEFPFSALSVYTSSFLHGSYRLASNRGTGRNVSSVECNPLWAVANHTPIHASILHNGACSCALFGGASLIYGRLYTRKVNHGSKPYIYLINYWFWSLRVS